MAIIPLAMIPEAVANSVRDQPKLLSLPGESHFFLEGNSPRAIGCVAQLSEWPEWEERAREFVVDVLARSLEYVLRPN